MRLRYLNGSISYIIESYIYSFTIIRIEIQVMMNAMNVPSKRSTLEKKLDKVIATLFGVLLSMCLIGAIGRYKIIMLNLLKYSFVIGVIIYIYF